jgi:hypothetical protein
MDGTVAPLHVGEDPGGGALDMRGNEMSARVSDVRLSVRVVV